ncbi:MAG: hypothetical protein VB035_04665 [Candidatus Fimivivens sp.]|nr:hypothetical protein [Candidatus Fimivivens sp.]
MEKDYSFAALTQLRLLSSLCEEQEKTTLALKQLEETQNELLAPLESLKSGGTTGGSGSALGTTADYAGILAAVDVFSGGNISNGFVSLAIKLAKTNPVAAGIVAMIVGSIGTFAFLEYEMEQGWIERPNMDQMNETANSIDDIMAASNPFIYQGEDELTPGRKGGRAGQRLDEFKQRQATIEQATETLNTIGDIYAASNPHLYQPTASFNAWQTNQPQPTATFDGWQQQQTQLADMQAQTTQFWQTYSESTQNQPITLNITNNFKGVTQDRKSLNEISDYMARQIIDDLNAGRPLYSHN